MKKSHFGNIRELPSGRWQARYTRDGVTHNAPAPFDSWDDAASWLDRVAADIRRVHLGCPTCVCRWDDR